MFHLLFYLVGYFLFMLVFMGIAIKTLKVKWYIIGAVFQLCAMLGQKLTLQNKAEIISTWIVYFAILLITACVMKRKNKKNNS